MQVVTERDGSVTKDELSPTGVWDRWTHAAGGTHVMTGRGL